MDEQVKRQIDVINQHIKELNSLYHAAAVRSGVSDGEICVWSMQPYRQEFEFAFSKLYYMNTLFTYMLGVKKPKVRFLKQIAEGIRQEFPDFQENIYYQNAFDAEQKKLAAMHMESPLKFKLYFQLLWFYRRKIRHIQG